MPKVLVVDDIDTDRLLAGSQFDQEPDWVVSYANDGHQALESIENHRPDIVVTDLTMPNLNGLELVKAVTDRYPFIPVVLMTSQGSEEIAVKALQSGAASYVPKRILTRELMPIAKRVMSASRDEQKQAELFNHISRTESAELYNDFALISPLVHHFSQAARSFGLGDETGRRCVAMALDEALANAIYHGNLEVDSELREADGMRYYRLAKQRCQEPPYCDRRIYVTARYSRMETVISIQDEGLGFDPSELPDPTDAKNLLRPYGRGIMLMRTFMDDVAYNSVGNEVTLTKRHTA